MDKEVLFGCGNDIDAHIVNVTLVRSEDTDDIDILVTTIMGDKVRGGRRPLKEFLTQLGLVNSDLHRIGWF